MVLPSSEVLLPPIEVSETKQKICDVHVTAPPPPPEEKTEPEPQTSVKYVDETNCTDKKPEGKQLGEFFDLLGHINYSISCNAAADALTHVTSE